MISIKVIPLTGAKAESEIAIGIRFLQIVKMMVLKQFIAINAIALFATIALVSWYQHNLLLRETQWLTMDTSSNKAHNFLSSHPARYNDTSLPESLPCNLLSHPAPMILMSLGRSGTSSMYQVISTLSGEETTRIFEYTGGSTEKSRHFFQHIVRNDDMKGDWLIRYLCHEQKKHPKAGVVAFKWKPYETLFDEEKALQGLTLLGKLRAVQIKVVRSKRNLLDVMISR